MTRSKVRGPFDVTMSPAPAGAHTPATGAPERHRMTKRYHGDLDGESAGEMLSVVTATPGSAGYVALERFEGRLAGLAGGFALQHSGLMDRGKPSLAIRVVPDSGTGELKGIHGRMKVRIAEDGAHYYELEYELAPRP